jgi:hypothetical protein
MIGTTLPVRISSMRRSKSKPATRSSCQSMSSSSPNNMKFPQSATRAS